MADKKQCIAVVSEPPHYVHSYRCTRKASTKVGEYEVCGIHARVARKWDEQGCLDSMVKHWWTDAS